ncbi:MAG: ATP-binding protein [Arcobacter sp.]|uniref:ATP-binding protein n=1 Tax=Arcobacter sp. TaxID=1872629 RepID=UPI003B00A653
MKKYSLKYSLIILFSIFTFIITFCIGSISSYSLYSSNLDLVAHAQKNTLKQVNLKANFILEKIEKISSYIHNEYKNNPKILKDIVKLNDNIISILILNKKGIINDFYSQSNLNVYKGFDYSNKKYFESLKNNNFYWSDVFFSTIDEKPTITFSKKISNDNVVVIFINLEDFALFTKNYINTDGSHMIKMFDKKGVILIDEDNAKNVLQRVNTYTFNVFVNFINKTKPYTQQIYDSKLDDSKQIAMYTTIEKTGWKIIAQKNYQDLLNNVWIVVSSIIIILVSFIIVVIIIAIWLLKKVFIEIDNLNINVSNITNGKYNKEVKESFYKEFNPLIENFRKMQYKIDKREYSLEKSLKSFKSLFNSTMEIIILHKDSICIDANDVAVKNLGFNSKDELIGKNIMKLVSENSRQIVKKNLLVNSDIYEIEILKKDGTVLNGLVQGKFLELENDLVRVSAIIDITELKQKDEMLFHQSKMASMGEMIENIAHQWRQPLSTITTAASGVKLDYEYNTSSKENFYKLLNSIINNAQHLSNTIDDFRNFFKKDKKKEFFTLSKLLDKTMLLVESSFKNHDINVIKEIDETIEIENYKNELTQALINILNNAKDALNLKREENKYIEVSIFRKDDKAVIMIKDNAGGIDKDIINRIFEPYFTTKHQSQGTGIGLYMTHQIIVDHMKGNIEVENTVLKADDKTYKGCCFKITLDT